MDWIHTHDNWPHFTWNEATLTPLLLKVRHQQGRLLGRMESLGFNLRQEASMETLTADVVKSSAIEGEFLNTNEVRSSVATQLGLDLADQVPVGREVEGIVEMMLDATQNFQTLLTKKRLYGWHAALFPTGYSGTEKITVAKWRPKSAGAMQVVSGITGNETVHFEAIAAEKLNQEMTSFLQWFEGDQNLDWVLKAGIAHLWFVTIHPFEDGNGRIGRAISDLALSRSDQSTSRFYSLSTQIEKDRKTYYSELETQQRSTLDITGWLHWFLQTLEKALANADSSLENVLFRARLWEKANQHPLTDRQRLILNGMSSSEFKGYMNTSKYAKLAKCSPDSALRDIKTLLSRGVFVQNHGGGRSTSYRLAQIPEYP